MTTEPTDVLEEQKATFEAKNEDYSDTWIVSGIALSSLHDEPVVLDSDIDHIVNGNVHRLLDKVLRGYSATIINDDVNFEAAVDSFRDAATYAAMLASVLEGEPTERLHTAYDNALAGGIDEGDLDVLINAHESSTPTSIGYSPEDPR